MDGPSDLVVLLLLFAGLFLDWIKAVATAAIAIFIRRRWLSVSLALLVGSAQGLVGARLELLDIYMTRDGWASLDALALITVAMSALASLAWWMIARAIAALARR